jgi:hypothetical protein
MPRAANWPHLPATIAAMLLFAVTLYRANCTIRLVWDASPAPDITKYKVDWGSRSGVRSESLEVGITTATFAALNEAIHYFVTITATNTAGIGSEPSKEVSDTTPSQPAMYSALPTLP